MMKTWHAVCGLLVIALASTAYAQEVDEDPTRTLVFEDIIVTAAPEEPETEEIPKEVLDWTRYINVGEVINDLPGVSAVRRGAEATEPVIRGLGWERVQTQVGPIPIFGGCPARMDPPITYLHPDKVQRVTVIKGIPSVTLGPGGTGGRVIVSTDYERSPGAPPELGGWITGKYAEARDGFYGGIGVKGGNRWLDFYGSLDGLDYDNYESADGVEVPAGRDEWGGALSLGIRPRDNHRLWNSVNFVKDEGFESPSLPMDSDETETWIYNGGYRIDFKGGILEQIEVDGGLSIVDHLMSNRNRTNRNVLQAEASTDSDSFAARIKQNWRLASSVLLITGVDYYNLSRDGTRERIMGGNTFFDHIWPDATQWDLGAFAEAHFELASDWRLRIGGRIDHVRSDADAVDEVGLGGMLTIRQHFVNFYGPDAADVDDTQILGGGNLLLEWMATKNLIVHLGGGISTRPANITERFYAFAPAPGGFQIGNPALDPETKYELDLGAEWIRPWGVISASVFYYWFDDYILRTQVGSLPTGIVRGFENVDARLYGGELGAVLKPFEHWSFPVSLAYVRGKNTSEDQDLPEIPPFEARLAVRADYGEKIPWWVEFGGRFVADQTREDESFPEDETPGFSVFHLFAGVEPIRGMRVLLGIENLFDSDYHEHLTREAADFLPVDDLEAGDEIPAPGRSFHAMIRYEF